MATPVKTDFDIIRRAGAFGALSKSAFDKLTAPASVATYRPGEMIFRQGEPAAALHFVAEGWVKVFRLMPEGDEAVLHLFAKGESFAEAAAFLGGRYPASATAVGPSRVVSLPSNHVLDNLRQDPDIAFVMIASLSQHLHRLMQDVVQMKASTGAQRVGVFLLSLCDRTTGKASLSLPFEKNLLAARVGLRPESLSRAFNRLKRIGIDVQGATVQIADVSKLAAFVSNTE